MAWTTAKLSDAKIRAAKPSERLRKLSDGKGLQFWLTPQGGRYWRLEYRFLGKRKLLAIGTYPEISAEQARELASEARSNIQLGRDPSQVKREKKIARHAAAENSFAKIAKRLIAKKKKLGRALITLEKMEWILGKVAGSLGSKSITEIKTKDVIAALAKEQDAENYETARRMRTVIGEVFRFAIQNGLTENDPSHATRGAVITPKPKHYAAILEPEKYGVLLKLIDDYATRNVVTGSALQLMALLYPRPGELRQAQWSEFDLATGIWTIPAERMKLRQAHVKPMPRQAVAILKTLHGVTGPQGNVFSAVGRAARTLSENTMNQALRRMGIAASEHSSHGFRASASTLLNASNHFSIDAIEHSLAHQDKDAVRRAYARGDAMIERKKMAQWWGDYLDKLRGGVSTANNLVPLKRWF